MNSKTPGLAYLYPDTKYDDRVAANYFPQSDPTAQLLGLSHAGLQGRLL